MYPADDLKNIHAYGGLKQLPAQVRNLEAQQFYALDRSLSLKHEPETLSEKKFNLVSTKNTNYLPAAMTQAAEGRKIHEGDAACTGCKKGNGPWKNCITLEHKGKKFMKGAYGNCGYSNHFDRCDFSSHQPVPRTKSSQETPMSSPRRMGSVASTPDLAPPTTGRYAKVPIPDGIDQRTPAGAAAFAQALRQRACRDMSQLRASNVRFEQQDGEEDFKPLAYTSRQSPGECAEPSLCGFTAWTKYNDAQEWPGAESTEVQKQVGKSEYLYLLAPLEDSDVAALVTRARDNSEVARTSFTADLNTIQLFFGRDYSF
ncbi:hypothetical protein MBLNU230_g5561t1 [Neophaeotheca triangularis]